MGERDVRVDLLGVPRFRLGGRELDVGGTRQEKLLAVLALDADRTVSADSLVDALWDDDPPETARHQVYNAVSSVRRKLGPANGLVVSERHGYLLRIPALNVDVHRFRALSTSAEQSVAEGRYKDAVEALEAGLALWRGPALSGLDGFAMHLAATKLNEERATALERLMRLRLDRGGGPEYVVELRELVGSHPYRDSFRGQLMLALYRSGRQAEALEVYEQGRALLARDLGLDVRADLQRLHGLMLHHDPALDAGLVAAAPAAQPRTPVGGGRERAVSDLVPAGAVDFTGRAEEVGRLRELVVRGGREPVVVCVDGMAGVGKTALVLHCAHLLAERHPDGRFFVDLLGHAPGQEPLAAAAALDQLLRSVGFRPDEVPAGVEQRAAAWRAAMTGRRALVILDDARDAAQVRRLLPATAGTTVLVTSRRRLLGLDSVRAISLDVMSEADATQLFAVTVGADRAGARSDAAGARSDAAGVRDVVALCGRLPLAIRIAAARLRHRPAWTAADLESRLRTGERRLAELVAGDRSVATAFEVSYQQLDERQRGLFRLLGLYPGRDFTAAAAAALADGPSADVEDTLEGLVDVNLLGQYTAGRYQLHDLIAQYARDRMLREEPEERRAVALAKLRHHFCDLADGIIRAIDPRSAAGRTDPAPPDPEAARGYGGISEVVRTEMANYSALIRQTASGPSAAETWHLAVAVAPLLVSSGYPRESVSGLEIAVRTASEAGDGKGEAEARLNIGVAYRAMARNEESRNQFGQAMELFRALDDRHGAARSLLGLAQSGNALGDVEAALGHFEQALELFRELGAEHYEAMVLGNIGVLLGCVGRYDEALAYHELALSHSRRLANPAREVVDMVNVGWVRSRLGDLDTARTILEEALKRGRQMGARYIEGAACWSLGDLCRTAGDHPGVVTWSRRALVVARETGDPDLEACTLNLIGSAWYAQGKAARARESYIRALTLTRETGLRLEEAIAWEGLAEVARGHRDLDGAADYAKQAVALFVGVDSQRAARLLRESAAS